jgi:hypothetical protein
MISKNELLALATGGLNDPSDEMMPATGPRPLMLSEPDAGLIWLSLNGTDSGFQRDQQKYRLWPYIAKKGCEFEAAYRKHECPEAIVLLKHDTHIRTKMRESVEMTIDHIRRKTPAMAKVGLVWQPAGVYGVCDFVFSSDYWYAKHPEFRPDKPEPFHYIIADAKIGMALDSTRKKDELEAIAVQLRIYSFILGNLQGYMAKKCYVISRDHIHNPIEIDVNLELGQPLPEELCDLRDQFRYIRQQEKQTFLKQKDTRTLLNPANKQDGDWHDAKQTIIRENLTHRPLVTLPGVGSKIAARMKGYGSVDDLLALSVREIERLNLETVEGIDHAKAQRIKSVLKANKTGVASTVPVDLMPKRNKGALNTGEYFVDIEHVNSMNIDFDAQWPDLTGTPMIVMIGVGWREKGEMQFKRFVSEEQTIEAEGKMLRRFVAFIRERGVLDPTRSSTLFCFSSAERTQMRKAAERHGLTVLRELDEKWFDVMEVFVKGPVVIPGQWSFGLKQISQALSEYAPRYSVEYGDEIGNGGGCMVAAWSAYEQERPAKSKEMALIEEYLKNDVLALCNTVMWLRAVCRQQNTKSACHWYAPCRTAMVAGEQGLQTSGWYGEAARSR